MKPFARLEGLVPFFFILSLVCIGLGPPLMYFLPDRPAPISIADPWPGREVVSGLLLFNGEAYTATSASELNRCPKGVKIQPIIFDVRGVGSYKHDRGACKIDGSWHHAVPKASFPEAVTGFEWLISIDRNYQYKFWPAYTLLFMLLRALAYALLGLGAFIIFCFFCRWATKEEDFPGWIPSRS